MPVALAAAGAWMSAHVGIVITAALTLMSAAIGYLTGPRMPTAAEREEVRRGWLVNTCDNTIPLPLIYGRCRVGINRVFVGTSGADNKYLHIIGNLCEGEIEGIVKIGGVDQLFLGDELYTEFSGKVHYEMFNGTPSQGVCATLKAVIPEWNDPKRNTTYIYIRLEYDQDVFSGLPDFSVLLDGLKIHDPNTGVTAYSNNPALIARDFITRTRGGMGIAEARIDDAFVTTAADYCNTKGWTCDIVLNGGAASDMLEQVLATFRGALLFSDDTYKIKFRDLYHEGLPVLEIDDNMVVEQGGQSTLSITQPSIFNTPNAVRMRFVNKEKAYTDDDYQLADLDAQAADGYVKEHQIDVKGITATDNVMKMANYYLERLRLNKTAGLQSHSRAMQLEPHDLIHLTHTRPGWDKKIMRITGVGIGFDGNVALSLEEEYDQLYDDVYEITPQVFYDTTLPNPKDPVPSVANVSIAEETYYYRGRSFTRLKVSWNPPVNYPWFAHADVYVRIGDGDWQYMTAAEADYQIDPVEEGEQYSVRLVAVSIWGSKEPLDGASVASHNVMGAIDAPPDVTGFTAIASGDAVSIYAHVIDQPDIFGYEVRSGQSWDGGALVGQNETPNIRLVGVKPGTLTLWMKAVTNAGIYSVNPASTQVVVFGPANYQTKAQWQWNYDGIGIHHNTGHFDNSGVDALRVASTEPPVPYNLTLLDGSNFTTLSGDNFVVMVRPDALSGTWTSPVYDLGSVQPVRIWGDFITGIISDALTWGGVFRTGETWGDRIAPGQRWYQVWTGGQLGSVTAKLLYGDSDPPGNEIDGFEMAAPEVSARYIQVEITIANPNMATHMTVNELNMMAAYWE